MQHVYSVPVGTSSTKVLLQLRRELRSPTGAPSLHCGFSAQVQLYTSTFNPPQVTFLCRQCYSMTCTVFPHSAPLPASTVVSPLSQIVCGTLWSKIHLTLMSNQIQTTEFPQRCPLGCFKKTIFQKNKKRNPPRISLGVSLNRSKRIFDFDQV